MAAVIGALRVDLDLGTAGWEAGLSRAQRDAKGLESKFQRVGRGISTAGAVMTAGITAPFVLFARSAISAASDAGELRSAFDATFGALADDMNRWAVATGDAMGRSTQEMQKGANAFGLYFNQAAKTREEAAKMSQTFTVLAQDLASFHNTSVDEALLALRSGLSGETEPLRRYGVFLNEAAIKAKAADMGLVGLNGKLTDQQKIMARAAIIMDATATAQGDVLRTSESTANQTRAMNSAWEELQVTVGTQLLPVITPLIAGLSDVLRAFTSLPASVQSTVIVVAALGAALGPIMLGLGPLVGGLGALIPLMITWKASMAAAAVTAGGYLPLLAPLLPIIAGIAAAAGAAYLVWKNWDTIGPMLQGFGKAVMDALGPSVINLFNALKDAALAVWNSAFVQGLGEAIAVIGRMSAITLEAFGSAIPGVLRAIGALFSSVFDMIASAIRFVVALLSGDWQGAWNAAKDFVGAFARGVGGILSGLLDAAIGYVSSMVSGIDEWLGGALTRAWDKVKQGVEDVKGYFRDLWDAVVGHSYVPDMVDGIAAQMARLDAVLVAPARAATKSAADAFRDLTREVRPLMDRLFPEAAALRQFREEMELIRRASSGADPLLTADQAAAARARLSREGLEGGGPVLEGADQPIVDVSKGIKDLVTVLPDLSASAQDTTAKMVESFAGMARDVLGSLRSMVSSFKGGDILGGLSQLLDVVVQVAGLFNGGAGGRPSVNVTGGMPFGGNRAMGGPTIPGKRYRVGERGPEWFTPTSRGRIEPDMASRSPMMFDLRGAVMTEDLLRQMEAMADGAAVRGAQGGRAMALTTLQKQAGRSFG